MHTSSATIMWVLRTCMRTSWLVSTYTKRPPDRR
nr:MAG TPA: hypothetical protein [Caudoviricetes sp.]